MYHTIQTGRIKTHIAASILTDRQKDIQIERDRQTDRKIDRQTDRQTDLKTLSIYVYMSISIISCLRKNRHI